MSIINKNFEKVFYARLFSNAGDSIYEIALMWYIFQKTHSTVWTGYAATAMLLPDMISFIFGKYIDRFPKKYILIFLELLQAILNILLIFVALFFKGNMWPLLITIFLINLCGTLIYPTQDAMVPEIVEEHQFTKAQSFLSFAYSGTNYLFNAIAGFLLTILSFGEILSFNIVTFVVAALLLYQIKINSTSHIDTNIEISDNSEIQESSGKPLSNIKYMTHSSILPIIIVGFIFNLLFGGLNVYQVVIAQDLGGVYYYGWLQGLGALGVLIGTTIIVNVVVRILGEGKLLLLGALGLSINFFILSQIHNSILFLIIWTIGFIFLGLSQVSIVPILQHEFPNNKLGSLISLFYSLTAITLPIGSLLFGWLGKSLTANGFLLSAGFISLMGAIPLIFSKRLLHLNLSLHSNKNRDKTTG